MKQRYQDVFAAPELPDDGTVTSFHSPRAVSSPSRVIAREKKIRSLIMEDGEPSIQTREEGIVFEQIARNNLECCA
jgi:hypothetical protein